MQTEPNEQLFLSVLSEDEFELPLSSPAPSPAPQDSSNASKSSSMFSREIEFRTGVSNHSGRIWNQLFQQFPECTQEILLQLPGGIRIYLESSWTLNKSADSTRTSEHTVPNLFEIEDVLKGLAPGKIEVRFDKRSKKEFLALCQGKFKISSHDPRYLDFFTCFANCLNERAGANDGIARKPTAVSDSSPVNSADPPIPPVSVATFPLQLRRQVQECLQGFFDDWYSIDLHEPFEECFLPHRPLFALQWISQHDSEQMRKLHYILIKKQSLLDLLGKRIQDVVSSHCTLDIRKLFYECAPVRGKGAQVDEWFPQAHDVFAFSMLSLVSHVIIHLNLNSLDGASLSSCIREFRTIVRSFLPVKQDLKNYFSFEDPVSRTGVCRGKPKWWNQKDIFVIGEITLLNIAAVLYSRDLRRELSLFEVDKWERVLRESEAIRTELKIALAKSREEIHALFIADVDSSEADFLFLKIVSVFKKIDNWNLN